MFFISFCTNAIAVDWSLWPSATGTCSGTGEGTRVMEADGTATNIGAWHHHGAVYARTYVAAVAVKEVNSKVTGIQFCPRQFNAYTRREKDLVTQDKEATYFIIGNTAGNDSGNCVWLCAKGYGGSDCSVTAGSSTALNNPYTTSLPGLFDEISLQKYKDEAKVTDRITAVGATSVSTENCNGSSKQPAINIYVVQRWLTHGAVVAMETIHAKIDGTNYTKNGSNMKKTYVRAGVASKEVIVCSPGYAVNSAGTDCEPYCGSKPSVCSYTNGSYGIWNIGYQYTMNSCSCSCDTSCKWTTSVKSSRCNTGYYGSPTLGYNGSSLYVMYGSCTQCPYDSVTGANGTTSGAGATSQSDCYRPTRSGSYQDDVGWYTETGTAGTIGTSCYYVP